MKKKFAIVSTWNGEGYSYENKLETILECSLKEALEEANKKMFKTQGVEINVEEFEKGFTFSFKGDQENHGSFQIVEILPESFAIVIECLINEVGVLNEEEFNNLIESIDIDTENFDEDEMEDDEFFLPGIEMDYQIIKL